MKRYLGILFLHTWSATATPFPLLRSISTQAHEQKTITKAFESQDVSFIKKLISVHLSRRNIQQPIIPATYADVDYANLTVAHLAASINDIENLAKIIAKKGSLKEMKGDGKTPLLTAARFGQLQSLKFLLQHGVPASTCDNSGRNALHHILLKKFYTSHPKSDRILHLLIQHGASPTKSDFAHQQPIGIARKNNVASFGILAGSVYTRDELQLFFSEYLPSSLFHASYQEGRISRFIADATYVSNIRNNYVTTSNKNEYLEHMCKVCGVDPSTYVHEPTSNQSTKIDTEKVTFLLLRCLEENGLQAKLYDLLNKVSPRPIKLHSYGINCPNYIYNHCINTFHQKLKNLRKTKLLIDVNVVCKKP